MASSIIEINSFQLITNLKSIRTWINNNAKSNKKICLPVKSEAYGHGLIGVAKVTEPHVDYFAVASINEAISLRNNKITKPILIFGTFTLDTIYNIIKNGLEITLASIEAAMALAVTCQKSKQKCKVHIKIDTGMNRFGVSLDNAWDLIKFTLNSPNLELIGIYSHLAFSGPANIITQTQIANFTEIVNKIKLSNPEIICHLANSAGICYYPDSYFDMVRPGILSYGYFPNQALTIYPLNHIKPCFALKSQIIFVKTVDKDQGISYNYTYITKTKTQIVTIPIGYGDGYRRILSNLGEILINGNRYKVAGNICMDMLMVDIGISANCKVGDEVVLIGKQGEQEISIESIADKYGSIIYEVLCGFNNRIERKYY